MTSLCRVSLTGEAQGRTRCDPQGVIMDVVVWLRSLGLGQYETVFRENEIDENGSAEPDGGGPEGAWRSGTRAPPQDSSTPLLRCVVMQTQGPTATTPLLR